jgi:predicted RNA-binding Zn-ribbon protein involved in translation (DUF1610 family)
MGGSVKSRSGGNQPGQNRNQRHDGFPWQCLGCGQFMTASHHHCPACGFHEISASRGPTTCRGCGKRLSDDLKTIWNP